MCNNESHISLSQPEHFVRHTMEIERLRAEMARGIAAATLDRVIENASDALELVDPGVPPECTHRLEQFANGDLQAAANSSY